MPDQLSRHARIFDLVRCDARKWIGRGVANAVAGGLDRMQFGVCQFGQDVRHLGQLDPVQLQIVALVDPPAQIGWSYCEI